MLVADGRLEEADGRYRATGELGTLAVPQSLRALITARLDALPADDRRFLQDASVLGHSFGVGGLAAVSGVEGAGLEARLRGLVRRELLVFEADPRAPERGQYSFTQSLIAEVAYSTLARPERRARHLAAARYLESSGGDETAAVLAGHYLSAYEASAQGPEKEAVGAQARVALRAAAERAAALRGHKQAAAMLEQALSVTSDAGERARLQEQRAIELYYAGRYDDANVAIHEAVETYRTLGDTASRTRAQAWLGPILIHAGRLELAANELKERARRIAARCRSRRAGRVAGQAGSRRVPTRSQRARDRRGQSGAGHRRTSSLCPDRSRRHDIEGHGAGQSRPDVRSDESHAWRNGAGEARG